MPAAGPQVWRQVLKARRLLRLLHLLRQLPVRVLCNRRLLQVVQLLRRLGRLLLLRRVWVVLQLLRLLLRGVLRQGCGLLGMPMLLLKTPEPAISRPACPSPGRHMEAAARQWGRPR